MGERDNYRKDGDPGMTHDEVGKALGVTGSRVQQIEAKALAKLRREVERRGWTFMNRQPEGAPEPFDLWAIGYEGAWDALE